MQDRSAGKHQRHDAGTWQRLSTPPCCAKALEFVKIAFPGKPGVANEDRQRLENWKLRRALALPYFLRSTTRESRVRKPAFLSVPRRSGSKFIIALARPWRTAPAWPDKPPPETVQMTSNWPLRLVATSGCWISMRNTGRAK